MNKALRTVSYPCLVAQSAVKGMVTELASEHSFEQLCNLGEGWLRVLALALDITARLAADCDLPRDWHQKLTEVLSEALRSCIAFHCIVLCLYVLCDCCMFLK